MKIRSGFVSNSSSSSFIIKDYTDTIQLTRDMLTGMITSRLSDDRQYIQYKKDQLKKFNNLVKSNKDFITNSIPITFPSCNYDTYIWVENNNIFIDTCNNEDWTTKSELNKYNFIYTDDLDLNENIGFWNFNNDIIVYNIPYNSNQELCNKHFEYPKYIFNKNTICCPQCYTGKTFTEINNKPPEAYTGLNIRRYQDSKDKYDQFTKRTKSRSKKYKLDE
ncbi:MAG: hypothetical protein M0R17_02900 [Candidatus Omnitrophica bacterium]|jgi:hypothetical protein|nr:hypothetical protein [Candidatus Omnitrophota bacterium]